MYTYTIGQSWSGPVKVGSRLLILNLILAQICGWQNNHYTKLEVFIYNKQASDGYVDVCEWENGDKPSPSVRTIVAVYILVMFDLTLSECLGTTKEQLGQVILNNVCHLITRGRFL